MSQSVRQLLIYCIYSSTSLCHVPYDRRTSTSVLICALKVNGTSGLKKKNLTDIDVRQNNICFIVHVRVKAPKETALLHTSVNTVHKLKKKKTPA